MNTAQLLAKQTSDAYSWINKLLHSIPQEKWDVLPEVAGTPHPIAKTKYEALDWNIKHTMYHCGQIGMIKRIVDQRYDFGLRKG